MEEELYLAIFADPKAKIFSILHHNCTKPQSFAYVTQYRAQGMPVYLVKQYRRHFDPVLANDCRQCDEDIYRAYKAFRHEKEGP